MSPCPTGSDAWSARLCSMSKSSSQAAEYHWTTCSSKSWRALDRRGGKMTSVALARELQFPTLRLPGLLAKMQRILNVDGYPVLSRDDAADTVELNRDLLLKQFDLV